MIEYGFASVLGKTGRSYREAFNLCNADMPFFSGRNGVTAKFVTGSINAPVALRVSAILLRYSHTSKKVLIDHTAARSPYVSTWAWTLPCSRHPPSPQSSRPGGVQLFGVMISNVRHPESLEPGFPVMEISTMGHMRMLDAMLLTKQTPQPCQKHTK